MSSSKGNPATVLRAFCGAMAASVVVAGVIGYVLAPEFAARRPGDLVVWALVAAAAALLVAAAVVERVLAERPSSTGDGPSSATARAKIVGFALREASGLLGALTTLLTGDRLFVVTFGAFAVLAMALAWPSADESPPPPR